MQAGVSLADVSGYYCKMTSGQLPLVDLCNCTQWLKQPTRFCSAIGICCMMLVNIDFKDENLEFYYKLTI